MNLKTGKVKDTLRIGLLIDRDIPDLWEYRIIKGILNSESGEIVLVIRNPKNTSETESGRYSSFYRWYEKFDRYFFRDRIDYDTKSDISGLIEGIPILELNDFTSGIEKNYDTYLSSELLRFNLDLIVCLGEIPEKMSFLRSTPLGIWYYCIGDRRVISGGPPGYWEIAENMPEIGAAIHMTDKNGEDFVILPTWVSTYPSSVNVTRDQILGFSSVLFPRLIKAISLKGPEYLDILKQSYSQQVEIKSARQFRNPSFYRILKNLFLVFRKYLIRKFVNLNPDPWFLIYKPDKEFFPKGDNECFKVLKAPSGYFWADPFIVKFRNRVYIFIEEYVYKTNKGHISVIEMDEKGEFSRCYKILEQPYHMSYPFVFEYKEAYYMVPETSENKTIQLYRCKEFPDKWEFVSNLMENVTAVDTTLFFKDGKWWLFTSIDLTETKTAQFNELFLFYSDDLFSGTWQSHPNNPIVTDLKLSRSAGRIFCDKGKVFRPSQDCSGRYGYALNLNQIIELNEFNYLEVLTSKIIPDLNKKLLGLHTFNFETDITILDVSSHEKRIKLNPYKKAASEIKSPFNIVKSEEQRKIKILFFIDGLTSGGKERRLMELMKGLKLLPYINFELVLMNDAVHYTQVFDLGIKIHFIIRHSRKDFSVFKEFYNVCTNFRPDIVHCWDSMTAVYLIPTCLLLKIRIINGMVVDTPVQQNILNKNWLRARLTFPFAKMVVGNSFAGLAAYRAPSKKALCIYNGMDLTRFENLTDRQKICTELFGSDCYNNFIVGMVAAFQPRKDYKTLVSCAIRILSDIKEMRFVLVGSGMYLDEVRNMVPQELSGKIIFTGPRSDVESIVNIFDVGILLTNTRLHGEGISNSIIEYMALRKPVIANRGGGTDEVVEDQFNGFLIDSENENQLLEKILFFFNNKKLINEFGRNGRKLIEEKFDIKIMTENYIKLYRKITFH